MATMSKNARILKELDKLRTLFHDLPQSKLDLCAKLIQNAAFMAVDLEDLQEQIIKEGPVVESTNGNGFLVKNEHPAQKSYNTMIARYTGLISKLAEMLPPETARSKLDAFLNGK